MFSSSSIEYIILTTLRRAMFLTVESLRRQPSSGGFEEVYVVNERRQTEL
jgi:hypothetical protein